VKNKKLILSLCIIGLLVALIALYYHYDDNGSKICDISETFSCSTVYKSEWSYIFGFPVPLLGIIGYIGFALLAWFRKSWMQVLDFSEKDSWWYLALIATTMFLYQSFMTSLEVIGIIPAFCILCLISQVVVIGLLFLSWRNWRQIYKRV